MQAQTQERGGILLTSVGYDNTQKHDRVRLTSLSGSFQCAFNGCKDHVYHKYPQKNRGEFIFPF